MVMNDSSIVKVWWYKPKSSLAIAFVNSCQTRFGRKLENTPYDEAYSLMI
jgi:hypothetical protein